MAKTIIRHGKLELRPLRMKHVTKFVPNMSEENRLEFEHVYQVDPLSALIDVLDDQMVYAVIREGEVLGITGISDDGQLWAVFAEQMKRHLLEFMRASGKLISFYHKFHTEIYCEFWAKSAFIAFWLTKLGFTPDNIGVNEANGVTMLRFVRCISQNSGVESDNSRPVMH